ncbi:transporter substrate-binding domain-containing protein [Undibacterium cyanobacteriorum]|uniref:Transporter substrate-binding domain-containing protein n=1 Tax=Undibacterium cyanobacteriorum TaxID=3073561 RepID=A0ABY9RG77_9BURK|nr:transporter substrate-binding domain-containing protein [Undibacterium sp. 20NA77.5]WMW80225.1 transporter substrate-binding domain-containing protein [Undibacterium sp. 20NA77.5]
MIHNFIRARRFFLCASLLILGVQQARADDLALYCEEDRPLQFYNAQGKLTGFTIEIVEEIQKRIGTKFPIQVVPWARGVEMLNRNPNTLLFTMARTTDRESAYQWIGPIASVTYELFAKADADLKINNLDDARKLSLIGVYRNDIRDQTLTKLGFTNLDRAASNISSFKKLMVGRVAVYADSKLGVAGVAKAAGYQVSDVKSVFRLFDSHLYIAASKSTNKNVVAQWNEALDEMKKDKTFQRLQKKYNIEE